MSNFCPQCNKLKPDTSLVFMRPQDVCNCLIEALAVPDKGIRAAKLVTAHVKLMVIIAKKMVLSEHVLTQQQEAEQKQEFDKAFMELVAAIEREIS